MDSITRTLAGLVVGAIALLGTATACAVDTHSPAAYVAETREYASSVNEPLGSVTDEQLIYAGQSMCTAPMTLTGAENDAPETYVKMSQITAKYCDVLGTPAPVAPSAPVEPAAASEYPTSSEPVALTLGQPIDTGSARFTVTKVDRCVGKLRITAEMETYDWFSSEQSPFHNVTATDRDGFTVDPDFYGGGTGCGDELASGYQAEAGNKYRGVLVYDVPPGASQIQMTPLNDVSYSLDIAGK